MALEIRVGYGLRHAQNVFESDIKPVNGTQIPLLMFIECQVRKWTSTHTKI